MAISDERLQHYAESDYKGDDVIIIDIPIIAKELISHRERTCRLENMITRDKEKLTRLESEYENLLDKRRKYVKKQNKKIKVLKRICLESYQVVSTLAFKLGIFESSVKVGEALDNLSQCKLIHDDILPFDAAGYFSPGDSYNNELRKITQGHTKLVDCDEIKNNDFELIVFDAEDDEGYVFYKGNKYYFTNAEKKINLEHQLECKLSDYGTIIRETIHMINELRDKKIGKTGQLNNVNELSEILCYAMTAYDHCNKEKYK